MLFAVSFGGLLAERLTMKLPEATEKLDMPRDAAGWFARMQSGEATEAEQHAFDAWLAADPAHAQAYRKLEFLWQATLQVPESRLRDLMAAPRIVPRAVLRRRRIGLGLGIGLAGTMALGAAGLFVGSDRRGRLLDSVSLATLKGERRQAVLSDGSVMTLNTDTQAVVRYYDNQRLVVLRRGEAFFDVRRDAERPFIVNAGMGQIEVTGTRFNVRRDAEAMQVAVESGSVLLRAGRWDRRSERRLQAGQQTGVQADQALEAVTPVDLRRIVAWQQGKVIFDNTPLAQVVEELRRYLTQPLSFEAAGVGGYRVSGVFGIDDPEAMIAALPAIAPVRVQRQDDGRVRILAL